MDKIALQEFLRQNKYLASIGEARLIEWVALDYKGNPVLIHYAPVEE